MHNQIKMVLEFIWEKERRGEERVRGRESDRDRERKGEGERERYS